MTFKAWNTSGCSLICLMARLMVSPVVSKAANRIPPITSGMSSWLTPRLWRSCKNAVSGNLVIDCSNSFKMPLRAYNEFLKNPTHQYYITIKFIPWVLRNTWFQERKQESPPSFQKVGDTLKTSWRMILCFRTSWPQQSWAQPLKK